MQSGFWNETSYSLPDWYFSCFSFLFRIYEILYAEKIILRYCIKERERYANSFDGF